MVVGWAYREKEQKRIRDASAGDQIAGCGEWLCRVENWQRKCRCPSEEEMRGVGRTRPAEVAKREEQEKETSRQRRICRQRRTAEHEDAEDEEAEEQLEEDEDQ